MSNCTWELRPYDQEIFDRELKCFVPNKIFDAHAHLHEKSQFASGSQHLELLADSPDYMGLEEYRTYMKWIAPYSQVDALFMPLAFECERSVLNSFVAKEAARDPGCLAGMVVTPDMDPEYVREEVRRHNFVDLKPYHCYSTDKENWKSDIETFLPDEIVRVANEEQLSITLHLVKKHAIADPANQESVRRYCEKYPDMKMILAHTARAFNPFQAIEGIRTLKGLDNVWFDTSGVTECGGIEEIVRLFGHRRLLFGTDFYVSHTRGRCVSVADSFIWLLEDMPLWDTAKHAEVRPTFVGIEALRYLKLAAENLGLTDSQIEDIFCNNARSIFSA